MANSNKYGKRPPIYPGIYFDHDKTFHRLCFIGISLLLSTSFFISISILPVSSSAASTPLIIGIGNHQYQQSISND